MTTLGPINSQNRVANYSANYRASLSLSPLSVECPCYTPGPPIIVAVGRLFVTAPDRRQDPAERFFFLPSPLISPAFCHARLIGFGIGGMRNLQKQASKTHRTVAHRADAHDSAPRAGIVWCATAPPIHNRSGHDRKRVVGRISCRFAHETDGNSKSESAACTARTVVFPLLVFPLSLSLFFLRFIFTSTSKSWTTRQRRNIKTRNGTVRRIDDIRAMGRRLIFTTLFPLYDSYGYFT